MRQTHINYFWVGIFVLAMFALLLAVLYRLTGTYTETDTFYVKYNELLDVRVGTMVTYGGYQIGQVSEIVPERKNGKTEYKVKLSVQRGWKIPDNSIARIAIPRLLSESSIDIIEGDSKTYLPPGGVIAGEEAITVTGVLRELNGQLKPLIRNLNRSVSTIGNDLQTEIPRITDGINKLLIRFNKSADQLSEILNDTNRRHLARVFENADTISSNLKNISRGFNQLDTQLDRLLNNSNRLLAENDQDIRRSVLDLRTSLETVAQHIDAIVYNLQSTSRNLNEFSRQLRQNPGALLRSNPPRDEAKTP